VRLFVAVLPDDAALDTLERALEPVRAAPGAPRWNDRSVWHLTLAFLGEVEPERLPPLENALSAVAAAAAPFILRLRRAGTFPGGGRPARVLWAGVAGQMPALRQLALQVQRAAYDVEVRPDGRSFTPHLTLGTWRPADRVTGWDGAQVLADLDGPPFRVEAMVLYSSRLGRQQPRYEPMRTFALAGPPP
jgi:RNA 2',3'-cyclic 3'-phosphodiesterase